MTSNEEIEAVLEMMLILQEYKNSDLYFIDYENSRNRGYRELRTVNLYDGCYIQMEREYPIQYMNVTLVQHGSKICTMVIDGLPVGNQISFVDDGEEVSCRIILNPYSNTFQLRFNGEGSREYLTSTWEEGEAALFQQSLLHELPFDTSSLVLFEECAKYMTDSKSSMIEWPSLSYRPTAIVPFVRARFMELQDVSV